MVLGDTLVGVSRMYKAVRKFPYSWNQPGVLGILIAGVGGWLGVGVGGGVGMGIGKSGTLGLHYQPHSSHKKEAV